MPAAHTARRSRVRRAAIGLYLIAANALVLALLLELGARVWVGVTGTDLSERSGLRFPTEDYHPFFRTANPPGPGISTRPEFHGWRILPPDADPEADGAFRILFLGGSTTAGRYPELTVQLLRERGVETLGFNAGAPMHTSLQSLYKLWTYADWVRPDVVIVLHNVNDLAHGFTAPAHALPTYRPDYSHASLGQHLVWGVHASEHDGQPVFGARPHPRYARLLDPRDDAPPGLLRAALEKSTLVRLVGPRPARAAASAPTRAGTIPPELYLRSLPAFRRNLENIRLSCAALEVPVVFATMPVTIQAEKRVFATRNQVLTNDGETYLSDEDLLAATATFNDAIRGLARPGAARVIDLAQSIRAPELFLDECHLKPEGLRREAELVARFLVKEGLVVERD